MSTPVTTEQLSSAVTDMDRMAQSAFSEIATFANMALAAMEKPESCADTEGLATVLKAIFERAVSAVDDINAMAEGVGSNYKDPSERRRYDARRKANEGALAEATA